MKKPETGSGMNAANAKPNITMSAPAPRTDQPANTGRSENVIGKGTLIEGNIKTDGDLRLEGTVKGDVSTKNTLIVSLGSVIEGNLIAQNADIAGTVHGTVQATGLLTIRSTGVIDGDVITTNLNVESGSAFTGRFQVGPTKSADAGKKMDTASVLG